MSKINSEATLQSVGEYDGYKDTLGLVDQEAIESEIRKLGRQIAPLLSSDQITANRLGVARNKVILKILRARSNFYYTKIKEAHESELQALTQQLNQQSLLENNKKASLEAERQIKECTEAIEKLDEKKEVSNLIEGKLENMQREYDGGDETKHASLEAEMIKQQNNLISEYKRIIFDFRLEAAQKGVDPLTPQTLIETVVNDLSSGEGRYTKYIKDGELEILGKRCKLDESQTKTLNSKVKDIIYNACYNSLPVETVHIALCNHFLKEPEAGQKISTILSRYVQEHPNDPKLREKVYNMTLVTIDEKNPLETKLLKDVAKRIVDAYKHADQKTFGEKVGEIWRTFVDSLPSVRASTKAMDQLAKRYITTDQGPNKSIRCQARLPVSPDR